MSNTDSGTRSKPQWRDHECNSNLRGFDLWETLYNLHTAFEQRVAQRVGPRTRHGDVRAAILTLLVEESMHGYQIIHEVEKRSNGAWKPSPGSVYPTLQLLVDEGLIRAKQAEGKKIYSLTKKGNDEAEATHPAPWESDAVRSAVLPKAGAKLAQAAVHLARGGTPEQVQEAVAVIDEARRKLYVILAQD